VAGPVSAGGGFRPNEALFPVKTIQGNPVSAVTSSQPPSPPALVTERDRDLLRRCLANAPTAWESFLQRFGGLLAFVVTRAAAQRGRTLSVSDRDDLIAEVMVELVRDDAAVLRGFAGRASLATYLTVIARRVAVRRLLRTVATTRTSARGDAADIADGHDHALAAADRDEIETLMGRLDPQAAQLVRLHHLEGRSYGDISRITGLPLGSIGPALSAARRQMRGGDEA
jgi:RNA polymerase sigma-70 factor (ECF subfamily)